MPTSAELMPLGVQEMQAGNFAKAEAIFRQVADAEPAHANARFYLGVLCQMQNRPAEAIDHYRQLLLLNPASAQGRNNLGLCLGAMGQLDEARIHCAEAVRLLPESAEFLNNLGTIHHALGQRDLAEDNFRRALQIKPEYAAAWNNLGKLHLAQSRADDAVRAFQKAFALRPSDATVLANLGSALLQQGKPTDAANCFRQALRLKPGHADALRNLASIQDAFEEWRLRAKREEERLRSQPDDADGYANLGDLYYYGLGKHEDAARCYQRVVELRPHNASARFLAEVLSGRSQLTRVPAERVAGLYDMSAAEFDQRADQRGDCSPQLLKAALGPPPAERSLDVLDLGCGTGLCGVQFRSWAKTLLGVDLAAGMLEKARQRGIYDELLHADLLAALAGWSDRFDLVVASDVLLFLGDLAPVFTAVQRALRSGGRFAFTIDLLEGPGDYRITPWAHFAHAPAYIERTAADAKLRPIHVQKVMFPRDAGHEAPGLVIVLIRS